MKIKILVVPTLIVASGFVGLSYLKPDFDTYMQKRALRDAAKASAMQADQVAQNVQALRTEIDSQGERVNFMKKYLPAEKDQGRIFDSLNFLTSQAGLLTSKIQLTEVQEEEKEASQTFATIDPVADADPLAKVDASLPAGAAPMAIASPYKAPVLKKYNVSIDAIGAYPNIKDLLNKLTTFDRMQNITSFKIANSSTGGTTEGEEGGAGDSGSTLTLTYVAQLPYQATPAPVTGEGIVNIPGLTQSNFDFKTLESIQTEVTKVPEVVLGTEGKANPFAE